jgi:hypothetical protein
MGGPNDEKKRLSVRFGGERVIKAECRFVITPFANHPSIEANEAF